MPPKLHIKEAWKYLHTELPLPLDIQIAVVACCLLIMLWFMGDLSTDQVCEALRRAEKAGRR